MSEKWDPDWVVHPGATLVDWMEENGVSASELATRCVLEPESLQGVLDGEQRITRTIAERLRWGTGTPAQFWLNRERDFRRGLAEGKTWTR